MFVSDKGKTVMLIEPAVCYKQQVGRKGGSINTKPIKFYCLSFLQFIFCSSEPIGALPSSLPVKDRCDPDIGQLIPFQRIVRSPCSAASPLQLRCAAGSASPRIWDDTFGDCFLIHRGLPTPSSAWISGSMAGSWSGALVQAR